MPLKPLMAAGGWTDPGTLLRCYDQPDEADVLAVTSVTSKRRGGAAGAVHLASARQSTDNLATKAKGPQHGKCLRAFELPLLGSNQDSSDPESEDSAFFRVPAIC